LNVPINIVGRADGPSVSLLEQLGMARISTASGPALVAMSVMRQVADELHATGEFNALKSQIKRADAQQLFATRSS